MQIWANHAHVFPFSCKPNGTVDKLLRFLDECDIEKAVAFAPFSHAVPPEIDPNMWLSRELANHRDRLYGLGTIDFRAGNTSAQVRRIRELGLRGIKLHPAAQKFHILSDPLRGVYEAAQEEGLFLVFHTGVHHHRIHEFRLIDFDHIAYEYPELQFTLEHVGGFAFFREAVGVIQNHVSDQSPSARGRVYAGLTSVFSVDDPHWYLSPRDIEELVFRVGAHQVVFGLDFPYHSVDYTRSAIGIIRHLDISQEAKACILGENLKELLGNGM